MGSINFSKRFGVAFYCITEASVGYYNVITARAAERHQPLGLMHHFMNQSYLGT